MLGPDGKPLPMHMSAAATIGGPKSLDDVPGFDDATIDELIKGMEAMIQQGTPLDVPAAMPIGQLAGMARTLRDLRARVAELEEQGKADPEKKEPPLPDLSNLFEPQ
jgi:hypothetical protein